jgi:hypothetical protein
MKTCAESNGIDWVQLQQCANGPLALELQRVSAIESRIQRAAYGTKGLPVVYVASPNGTLVEVHTTAPGAPLPLYCGPDPLQVLEAICKSLLDASPSGDYPDCANEEAMCKAIAASSRLPKCKKYVE